MKRLTLKHRLVLLTIGLLGGIAMFLVQTMGGPTAHQQLYAASDSQCGPGPFGVVSVGDDVLFVGGHAMSHRAFVRSGDPGFDDLVLRGGNLASNRILCGRNARTVAVECAGYYTQRDADLFEEAFPLDADSTETLRRHFEEWLSSPKPNEYMRGPDGGRTLEVRSMRVKAELRDIGTGQRIQKTETLIGGECTETLSHYDLVDSGSRGRMQVPPEVVEQLVFDLTGQRLP